MNQKNKTDSEQGHMVSTHCHFETLFEKAYALMNEPVIEGNCGELCDYHCCRPCDSQGEKLGMFLLPLEFEYMQKDKGPDYVVYRSSLYDMPPKIKKLYYIFCGEAEGCLRENRPIQCRTYPFEPHLDGDVFSLIIERDQLHDCPLLERMPQWREAFIEGVYNGWMLLLEIPIIRYLIQYESAARTKSGNIAKRYTLAGWQDV